MWFRKSRLHAHQTPSVRSCSDENGFTPIVPVTNDRAMKAVITAGGRGTRLRPLTHTKNKHLIPIANKAILEYAIDAVTDAGIREIGIVVATENGEEVRSWFGDGSDRGLSIEYIWQEEPLGLAHVVRISQDFVGSDPFVFYLGDNIVVGGIRRFVEAFEESGADCYLTLASVRDPERFGVPEFDDEGKIVRVVEKPEAPLSNYAVSGIYFYNSSIFEAVNAIEPSARGELEISDAHDWLLRNDFKVSHGEITGWWKDTGQPGDLLEANRLVLSTIESEISGEIDDRSEVAGNVIVGEGSRLINSTVRGPAIIGENTVIEDSYIGPYSAIGSECTLRGCEVEYSILMEKVSLVDIDIRVEGSLLGTGSEIVRADGKPRVQRFILGEQSRVELT